MKPSVKMYFARLFAVVTVFVVLLILLSLFGCEKQPVEKNKIPEIKIGVALYKQDDTFISMIVKEIEQTAKQREVQDNIKITMNFMDGKSNQGIQNDQVDKFLTQGCDVICVNMVDRTAASAIIDKAKTANVPIVFFNREPVEEDMQRWDRVYYVGAVATESGTLQAEIVEKAYNDNPELVDKNGDEKLQYVMLEGEPGHQDALIRTEYAIKMLTNAGVRVEKLANDTANWQRAQGTTKMAQWLELYGDQIEVVFSNNDDMALGAIDAYEALEMELPVIVGIDGTPPALESMKSGKLAGTVLSDFKGQAQAIFDISYALATGVDVNSIINLVSAKYVRMPHTAVTEDNLEQVMAFVLEE